MVEFSTYLNPEFALGTEFNEEYGHFFVTKKLDRSPRYALTFLFRKNTHLLRLGSAFLTQNPGSKKLKNLTGPKKTVENIFHQ